MTDERKWRYFRVFCIPKSWLLVVLLCGAAFIQGFVVNGLVNVTLSPIQRRFQLSSSEMGMVASIYDIANVVLVLPVTFLCARQSKSLITGLSFTILGLGGIVYSLPHFLDDDYTSTLDISTSDGNGTCHDSSQQCDAIAGINQNQFYYGFFLAGQALNGIGAAALWTLGTVYIDENLGQKGAPIAIGIFEGTGVLGPAVGFLLGGGLLSTWVDGSANQPDGLDPSNALWVGNWWAGFLIGGVLGLLIGILIAGLPSTLKDSSEKQNQRVNEFQAGQMKKVTDETGSHGDFYRSFWMLCKNIPFMFLIFTGGFEAGFVSNISTYGTKYIEEVYSLDAGTAAIAIGAVAVLAGAVGQTVGGVWIGKTNPSVKKQLLFGTCSLFLSLIFSFLVFYHCDETPFAGATIKYETIFGRPGEVDYTDDDINLSDFSMANMNHTCLTGQVCPCSLEIFDPVCVNGVSFFSPCHAGCDATNLTEITDCSCLPNEPAPEVTAGACPNRKKCHFGVFLACEFVVLFFTFINGVPATNSILRMVPPQLRSQAMGMNILMLRLIGSIPGPIIGGKLIDLSCVLWQQSCGSNGSCRLYNKESLMYNWLGIHLIYKFLGGIGWLGAYYSFKPETESEDAVRVNSTDLNRIGVVNTSYNDVPVETNIPGKNEN